MREFKFVVNPCEDVLDKMARWDEALLELHAAGKTILGRGPDGDEPIRFEGPNPADLAGPFTEVYEVVDL